MLSKVKPENLPTYVRKVEVLFPEFRSSKKISIVDIQKYYKESFWGYALFHSWSGAIHMALSDNGTFSKNDYFRQAEEIGEILAQLEKASAIKVLEVGCGRGFNIAYLAERFPAFEFIGVDINEENVKSAANRVSSLKNAAIEIGDFHNLSDIGDGSIDLVFGVETLCHATDMSKMLKSITRVMSKGGKLVVFDGFRSNEPPKDDVTARAVTYTERAMAVPEFRTVDAFVTAADASGLHLDYTEDRSAEIMPNLIRLSDLAKAFFKAEFVSKLIIAVFPRGLVTNAVAGLLMAVTVQLGAHRYVKLCFSK